MKEWVKSFCSKFLSVKNWCAIFFMVITGYIVFSKQNDFKEIGLVALVGLCAYMGVNIGQDWIMKK